MHIFITCCQAIIIGLLADLISRSAHHLYVAFSMNQRFRMLYGTENEVRINSWLLVAIGCSVAAFFLTAISMGLHQYQVQTFCFGLISSVALFVTGYRYHQQVHSLIQPILACVPS